MKFYSYRIYEFIKTYCVSQVKTNLVGNFKNEKEFYVFIYLLDGSASFLNLLLRKSKHNQIKLKDERYYFETWIYFGRTGFLEFNEDEGRFLIKSVLQEKIMRMKFRIGHKILPQIGIVLDDQNWGLSYLNHVLFYTNESHDPNGIEMILIDSEIKSNYKTSKLIFNELLLPNVKQKVIPCHTNNLWHLAQYLKEKSRFESDIIFKIYDYYNLEPFHRFNGLVIDENGSIYEIDDDDFELFLTEMKRLFNYEHVIRWEDNTFCFIKIAC
ncbi:MAG: hypothetical protein ACK5AY_08650 [Bacteroidota bacterium]